jgi:lipooligosaccharide transport system permease protein
MTPLAAYAAQLEDDNGQFALIQRMVVMPMFLFSGTFFPISEIPDWLEWVAWVSPLWHASQLGRVVSYGTVEPIWLTILHLVVLVSFAAVGAILTRRAYITRLTR